MSKTGGGRGTNQYAVRGVSQANQQEADVVDGLAASEGGDMDITGAAERLTEQQRVADVVRKKIQERLIYELADAILARDDAAGDNATWLTGSVTKPGVHKTDSGGLEAWAWDLTNPGETIVVCEHGGSGDVSRRVAEIIEGVRRDRRAERRVRARHR